MKKTEFLEELRKRLNGLPKNDIDDRVTFYGEMIDDYVENGMSEEDAVDAIGGVDNVVRQIAAETPFVNLVKEKIRPKRSFTGLEIAIIILGFPLWFPLLITGLVLTLVAYILLWVLVIVTYSVEISLIGGAIAGFIKFGYYLTQSSFNLGYLSIGILGIGASLLFIVVCVLATKLSIKITKNVCIGIKSKLIGGKRNA